MIYVIGEEPGNPGTHQTSARLARLCGVPESELLARVTWLNLFATPTPRQVYDLVEEHATSYDAILLLGRRVARAWRLEGFGPLQSVQRDNGPVIVLVPHPSGRNRWWNDHDHTDDAAIVLRGLWLRCAR